MLYSEFVESFKKYTRANAKTNSSFNATGVCGLFKTLQLLHNLEPVTKTKFFARDSFCSVSLYGKFFVKFNIDLQSLLPWMDDKDVKTLCAWGVQFSEEDEVMFIQAD